MKKIGIPIVFSALLLSLSGPSWSSDVTGESASAETAGHITGVGGVFFKAKDPKALATWYRDVLGLQLAVGEVLRCAMMRPSIRRR
ncbi:hypothetical protein S2091_2897 [Solimicrobium silvestre]|uniref:Glyoxalase-like domain n=1 Tax=Solimicrobium silvestre TaxID=2099400 RepID=A0A2S9GXS6_9BURK|nr:hypothetical protein S2091_2897 [Solimicrobium silvestre]